MAKVSGIWNFYDIISAFPTTSSYNVNFYSNDTQYIGIRKSGGVLYYIASGNVWNAIYDYNDNKWHKEAYKTINFGDTEQDVNNVFYSWIFSNTTKSVGEIVAEIKYGSSILGRLIKEQKATLTCIDQKMLYDVVVSFVEAGTITYNRRTREVEANKVAKLTCANKTMESNVIIETSEVVGDVAGLYDANDNSVATWEQLVGYGMNVEKSGYNISNYTTDINHPYYVFNHYSLLGGVKLIIENSVTSISVCAFFNCSNLTNVIIPNSVTSVDTNAFGGCSSLTSITIPDSVSSIGNLAFAGCSRLTSISIPESITKINNSTFEGCSSLTIIIIPNYVTSIGQSAFKYCSSLTSVAIGNSVEYIGTQVFSGCSSLKSVTIKATTPPTLSNINAFPTGNTGFTIYVPRGYGDIYKNYSTNWSNLASYIKEEDL